MSVREATYLCPELVCLPRDPDREARAFSAVIDAFDSVAAGVECLRPGLARCRARGPARWAGGEEQAASLLVEAIEEKVGVECFVGVADGPLASVEAARAGRIVLSDDTRSFLSSIGVTRALACVPPSMRERASGAVELMAGLGIVSCADLIALGRGPVCERFGDIGERLWVLASGEDVSVASAKRVLSDSAYQEPFAARSGPVRAASPWETRWEAPSMPRIWARAKTWVMRALMRASRGRPRSAWPSARR